MVQEDFDWGIGKVVYWDLDAVDPKIALDKQLDELKEDLIQASFGESTSLDVGWYPEFSSEGEFVVTVVRDQNWDTPIYSQRVKSFDELTNAINGAVLAAMK